MWEWVNQFLMHDNIVCNSANIFIYNNIITMFSKNQKIIEAT